MQHLCIDLGGSTAKIGLVQDGVVMASRTLPVDHRFTLGTLESWLRPLVATSDPAIGLASVGIAAPGVVDLNAGVLVAAHGKYQNLQGVSLTDWAAGRFQVPAYIENDARAALLGETRYGVAAGATDAVLMVLGTGIGTAAAMSGRLVRGARGHAGILGGHITVSVDGPTCTCGNVGCAESLASTWALERMESADPHGTPIPHDRPHGIEALVAAARRGDAAANRVLTRFVSIWGATLVSLCHSYDPSVAVVSGGVMKSHEMLLPRIVDYVHTHLWSSSYRPPILVPDNPQLSVMRGLAALDASQSPERTGS